MNAPIDIVISIAKRHQREEQSERDTNEKFSPEWHFHEGKRAAYEELAEELEGFKKLFN